MRPLILATLPVLLFAGCNAGGEAVGASNGAAAASAQAQNGRPFAVTPVGKFNQPWAMAFLPDGSLLVTEKQGRLQLLSQSGSGSAQARGAVNVAGVPAVDAGGQGGLGDVVLHPDFRRNRLVYLSWAEAGPGDTRGAAWAAPASARRALRRASRGFK
jgi:glucose/arabinose dehydrogenase